MTSRTIVRRLVRMASYLHRQDGSASPLDVGVYFCRQNHECGPIEPQQQHDGSTQGAIGLVIASDRRDVGRTGKRSDDPKRRRCNGAPAAAPRTSRARSSAVTAVRTFRLDGASSSTADRRQLTVMFGDLVGSTTLGEEHAGSHATEWRAAPEPRTPGELRANLIQAPDWRRRANIRMAPYCFAASVIPT
jgi:hypothetical protein